MSFELSSARTTTTNRLMLEVEERYARERYKLCRAKSFGPRITSPARLRELERAWTLAQSRLRRDQNLEAAEQRVRLTLNN
ncbi:MAG TPA: hypothetical protein VN458_07745 [Solirubrobacterales bacterium]|nr:hypothetical protein [Solirubrobacterales bacterium]